MAPSVRANLKPLKGPIKPESGISNRSATVPDGAAPYSGHSQDDWKRINEYVFPLEHNGQPVEPKGYLTDELSGEAVRFLNEAAARQQQPFFLYLCYNAPHAPMEATDADLAEFPKIGNAKRRTYAAMVYAVDRGVGRIVQTLKQNGQFDDTLILFLSDNGGKPSLGASNAPLRGRKCDTREGGATSRLPRTCSLQSRMPQRTAMPAPLQNDKNRPDPKDMNRKTDRKPAPRSRAPPWKHGRGPDPGLKRAPFIVSAAHRLHEPGDSRRPQRGGRAKQRQGAPRLATSSLLLDDPYIVSCIFCLVV